MPKAKQKIEYEISEAGCFEIISKQEKPVVRVGDKTFKVGRFIYEECFGTVPEGHRVVHKCMNSRCINPEHLKTLPVEEAVQEMILIREQRAKTEGGRHMLESEVRLARFMMNDEKYNWDEFEAAKQLGFTYEAFKKGMRSY